jgi:hypothetical protein
MNIQHVNRSYILYKIHTCRRQKIFHRETWPILMQNLKETTTEKKGKSLKVNNKVICFNHHNILLFNKLATYFGH